MNRTPSHSFFLLTAFTVALASGNLFATTFATLDDPLATSATFALGISGNNVVWLLRYATDHGSHGFVYNGSTYITLDDPLAGPQQVVGTFAAGISGNKVVGYYYDASDEPHGFVYNQFDSILPLDDPLGGVDKCHWKFWQQCSFYYFWTPPTTNMDSSTTARPTPLSMIH